MQKGGNMVILWLMALLLDPFANIVLPPVNVRVNLDRKQFRVAKFYELVEWTRICPWSRISDYAEGEKLPKCFLSAIFLARPFRKRTRFWWIAQSLEMQKRGNMLISWLKALFIESVRTHLSPSRHFRVNFSFPANNDTKKGRISWENAISVRNALSSWKLRV